MRLSTLKSFSPAAGEDVSATIPTWGATVALPAVDVSNIAMSITNTGQGVARINFGTDATITARPDMPGLFAVEPGATVLVDGAAAGLVGTATYAAVAPGPGGCVLTFQRGSTGSLQVAGLGGVL